MKDFVYPYCSHRRKSERNGHGIRVPATREDHDNRGAHHEESRLTALASPLRAVIPVVKQPPSSGQKRP